jgi:hypothetical protein
VHPGIDAVDGSYQICHDSGLQGWISAQDVKDTWRGISPVWKCERNSHGGRKWLVRMFQEFMPAVGTEDLGRYILGPSKKAGSDVNFETTAHA